MFHKHTFFPPTIDRITTTFNSNATTFVRFRNTFSHVISPVFGNAAPGTSATVAKIIQDTSVRMFYDLVAEAMGYRYVQFAASAIITPIPSTNGVAILWLSSSITKPSIASVQRILDTINRRESPNVVSLSDCQRSARSLLFLSHRKHAILGSWVSFHSPANVCVCVCVCVYVPLFVQRICLY